MNQHPYLSSQRIAQIEYDPELMLAVAILMQRENQSSVQVLESLLLDAFERQCTNEDSATVNLVLDAMRANGLEEQPGELGSRALAILSFLAGRDHKTSNEVLKTLLLERVVDEEVFPTFDGILLPSPPEVKSLKEIDGNQRSREALVFVCVNSDGARALISTPMMNVMEESQPEPRAAMFTAGRVSFDDGLSWHKLSDYLGEHIFLVDSGTKAMRYSAFQPELLPMLLP
jgi:hypothetical protein